MPARSVRTVLLAAVSITAAVGLGACSSEDDTASTPDTGAATTSQTSPDSAADTTAATSDSTDAGIELDVSAGGPYEGSAGSPLRLTAKLAVTGQSDIEADLAAIGAALRAYRDEHGTYPPAFLTDSSGTPTVSWRVLLLPYLDQADLYAKFDLTKPWDDPANEALIAELPDVYRADGAGTAASPEGAGDTAYAGVAGAKHLFRAGAAELGGGMAPGSVTDGDTMTIAVGPVGADVAIPWTSPEDVDTSEHAELGDPAGFSGPGGLTTPLLFLDGTVRTFADDIDAEAVLSWSTVAGGSCTPPDGLALHLVSGWDFDGDSEPDAYGSSVEFPTDEAGEHEVSLSVDDGLGGTHVVTTTVTVK